MGKVRVYDLAKKLGVDNKDMVDQLNHAGIEVKNHMAVLDDDEVRKFEDSLAGAKSGDPDDGAEVQEKRISSGLIRRRRSAAPKPADEPVVEEPTAVEPVSEPVPEPVAEVVAKPAAKPAEKPAAKPVAATKPETPVEEPPAQPTSEVAAAEPPPAVVEEPVAAEEPAAPAAVKAEEPEPAKSEKRVVAPKDVPGRAKILGRVELPKPAVDHGRRQEAPAGGRNRQERVVRADAPTGARPARPGAPTGDRPARPARPGAPTADRGPRSAAPAAPAGPMGPMGEPGKEGRSVRKKKKGRTDVVDAEHGRRKERREVYEPDRGDRYRKGKKGARSAKKTEITVSKAIKRKIRITDVITVGELAKRMGVKANDLIKELMRLGQMVNINHPLDFDTASLLAAEFSYEVENVAFDEETVLSQPGLTTQVENPEDLKPRPPVVTIMGHVDHGKTSLLDAIRQANVTEGEAGGITQHIGAYDVELDGRKITFLDTPGHEAFTAMRARGAKVTDIVVLVVAADDGVMPQTREAINHSKAGEVPIIVAVNKIDKPDANPDRVKQELAEFGLQSEDWGGDTIFVNVSAKQKTNIDQLLEMILLQAEVMDLKANPDKHAQGAVVEARLDKGRGPVATVLVQQGTLKIGDPIVAGTHFGRVRSMTDDRGEPVLVAGPSVPVEVTGLTGVPDAGETFHALEDEKKAREVAQHRQQKVRELELAKSSKISLEQLYARIKEGDVKELKVIVKADVQGSVEAVSETLSKLSTDACRLVTIHTGVGAITETDISLASASDAIVLGFNVRPAPKAMVLAESEGVDVRLYTVIYDAVNDVKDAMEGLLAPTYQDVELGRAEVREAFSVTKIGTIAGCYVTEGKILRNSHARLVRDNVVVWKGKIGSLRRFKDDVREVNTGYECGIGLDNYNDIKPGDFIESYEIKEIKSTL